MCAHIPGIVGRLVERRGDECSHTQPNPLDRHAQVFTAGVYPLSLHVTHQPSLHFMSPCVAKCDLSPTTLHMTHQCYYTLSAQVGALPTFWAIKIADATITAIYDLPVAMGIGFGN